MWFLHLYLGRRIWQLVLVGLCVVLQLEQVFCTTLMGGDGKSFLLNQFEEIFCNSLHEPLINDPYSGGPSQGLEGASPHPPPPNFEKN